MIMPANIHMRNAHTPNVEVLPPYIRDLPSVGYFVNGIFFGCKALAIKQATLIQPLTAKAAEMVTHDIITGVVSIAALREMTSFFEDGKRFGENMFHTTVDLLGEVAGGFGAGIFGEIGGKAIGTVVGSAIAGPVGAATGGMVGSYLGGVSASVAASGLAQKGCDYLLKSRS
jgi:hypothetical protein